MNIFRIGAYLIGLCLAAFMAFKNNPSYPIPAPIPASIETGPFSCGTTTINRPNLSIHDTTDYNQISEQIAQGKALFKNNCAACHNKNMKDDLTGPALAGVQDRWKGREELLYQFIRNSQAVIASGDRYAVDLYKAWAKNVMTPFPNLSDEEIESLLLYIEKTAIGF